MTISTEELEEKVKKLRAAAAEEDRRKQLEAEGKELYKKVRNAEFARKHPFLEKYRKGMIAAGHVGLAVAKELAKEPPRKRGTQKTTEELKKELANRQLRSLKTKKYRLNSKIKDAEAYA